jgi:hypothetical protein
MAENEFLLQIRIYEVSNLHVINHDVLFGWALTMERGFRELLIIRNAFMD